VYIVEVYIAWRTGSTQQTTDYRAKTWCCSSRYILLYTKI